MYWARDARHQLVRKVRVSNIVDTVDALVVRDCAKRNSIKQFPTCRDPRCSCLRVSTRERTIGPCFAS